MNATERRCLLAETRAMHSRHARLERRVTVLEGEP